MESELIAESYDLLCYTWSELSQADKTPLLDLFKVGYSYNSGTIENPEITFHDTEEVFDKGGVSNYTGDVRTLFEISNLKNAWALLLELLKNKPRIDVPLLLEMHKTLTAGTYDARRWDIGERPGMFKVHDYRVAHDVGLPPNDVAQAVSELLAEVNDAIQKPSTPQRALTIAAFAHARLVDIHPFADGNGRIARMLMNYLFMVLDAPPCSISAEDRMAYFGSLDAFHDEGDLRPFETFLMVQTLKTWGNQLEQIKHAW